MPISKTQAKNLKKLGERVKSIREAKGLSLQDLAFKIGKERQSVGRLETGNINPSYLYLVEVCSGLEITVSELLIDL